MRSFCCFVLALICHSTMWADNYPLTEAVLRKILVEACGLPPDTAKQRAAAVFGK